MDRNWMSASRLSKEYDRGVSEFIQFALLNSKTPGKILCPCKRCLNVNLKAPVDVRDDLFIYGIDPSYTHWADHGETNYASFGMDAISESSESEGDQLEEMAQLVAEDFHGSSGILDDLLMDAREALYPTCTRFTKLSAVLKLFNLKATHGWTDVSFTALLQLLKEMLPDENVLPESTFVGRKMLCSVGLKYERIHACPNDCVLYRKQHASLDHCPTCGESRYKRNLIPAKVTWYFPIIPRFKRLFADVEDAKKLRWHADERVSDGKLRHPADSTQWVNFDDQFPEFGCEVRNLRLALSTDGVNPHSNQSSTHSIWPVILVIYNLPPGLCMRRKYLTSSICQPNGVERLWLTPYNGGNHWMLGMINPQLAKVYWLDPLRGAPPSDFVKMCTTALNIFHVKILKAKPPSTISWITIKKCPSQKDESPCSGLFICRMMRDIIEKGDKVIPETYFPNTADSYTQGQLNKIMEEWLRHLDPHLQMIV